MQEDRIELWHKRTWRGRRFYWRAVAANGEIVASGEPYNSAAARNAGLAKAREIMGPNAILVDGRPRP